MLQLYDTRRREVLPFRPRGREVTMYVCGVTPYDTTHLGHARTFLVFDLIARILESRGRAVRYVQNVTDIDESILQRAARDGVDWKTLGRREERAFISDMRRLGWRRPDVLPHATRELPKMRELIATLISKGAAYPVDGSVYFDTARDPRYGELSRYSKAKMRKILAGQDDAALDDPRRRDPVDFALWRKVPSGPTWPSAYGPGRPGWHIECSAMALRYLGDHIDLHGGGSDLIYPHHENEIAQSESATGRHPVVGHWVHAGPVRLAGTKMSKSDGNVVFVRDALAAGTPSALRLYLFDGHYRKTFDHDEGRLARARERDAALAARLGRGAIGPIGRGAATRAALAALDDDLDTGAAIRAIERGSRTANAAERASLRGVARLLGIGRPA